jgi:hypothetical protein
MNEEIKSRLNSGNACYHSVQGLLSSRLLSRNLKVKIYKTVIQPVVLYGCEIWPFTIRNEHRLRVFEKRVLRRIFGPKRDEVAGEWRKLHSVELHNLYSSPDIIRQIKSRRMGWADMWHAWERREERNGFWWENPKERDHLEDQGVDGSIGSVWILERLAEDIQWVQLAQDRGRWRALVYMVMNLRVLTPRI